MVFSMMLNNVVKTDERDGHKERKLLVTLQPACVEEDECVECRVAVIDDGAAFQSGMVKISECLNYLQEAATASAKLFENFNVESSGALMIDDFRAEADICGRQVEGDQVRRIAAESASFEDAVTKLEQSVMYVSSLGAHVVAEWVKQRSRIHYIDIEPTRVRTVRPWERDEATEAESPAQETKRAEPDVARSQKPASAAVQALQREVHSLRDDFEKLRDEIRARGAAGPDQE